VRPTGRNVGDYREYVDENIRRVFRVESLRTPGLSPRQIGRVLEERIKSFAADFPKTKLPVDFR